MVPRTRLLLAAFAVLLAMAGGAVVMNLGQPSAALSTSPPTPMASAPRDELTTSIAPATTTTPAPEPTTAPTAQPAPSTAASPVAATTARPPTTLRPTPSIATAPVTVTTARSPTTLRSAPSTTQPPAGNTAGDALTLLNGDRTSRGLLPLSVRPDAQAKAQAWAEKLAQEGALYHSTLSEGLTQCWTAIAENIAVARSVPLDEQILMNDPPHRENILATKWTVVGVGAARGANNYYVVQVFVTGC